MRLPNFLIVGAPGAGTTAMHHYLSEHPEIYVPLKKELHYFSYGILSQRTNGPGDKKSLERCCSDFDDYKKYYQDIPPQPVAIGEASPSYLFFTECIPQIKEVLGKNVKILIMIRNPIERAFSMYSLLVNAKRESLPFFEALQAEEEREKMGWGDVWLYKAHSLYYEKIMAYMNAFGPENVKVIVHDDFKKDSLKMVQSVFSFLGVDPTFVPWNINIKRYGQTSVYKNRFVTFVGRPHPLKAFFRKLLPAGLYRRYRYLRDFYLAKQPAKKACSDERSELFLRQYFAHDIAQLASGLKLHLNWEK